jgi:hypothetical protein
MSDRQSIYEPPVDHGRDELIRVLGESARSASGADTNASRQVALKDDTSAKSLPPADITSEAGIKKDTNGNYTQELHHKQHQFKLTFSRDASNNLTEIHTIADNGTDGKPIKPEQVYKKDANGQWFYHAPDGKRLAMQGDLRIDEKTGEFTQVLRRDIDKSVDGADGDAKESTRTMTRDGTDIINRMDGSSSEFKYAVDAGGLAYRSEWTERDGQGNETIFQRDKLKDKDGKEAWVNTAGGDIRFDPKVQDNGNVTYNKAEDLGKNITQVKTSAGDQIADGKEGLKYSFNYRGDVSSIQFPKPRLFEGHRVDRIDIAYRDPVNNQGQIIDQLTLYNTQIKDQQGIPYPIQTFTRVKDKTDDPTLAKDQWIAARGRQGPYPLTGDYSIKDGEISTSEPLPKDEKTLKAFIESNPNVGKAITDYKKTNGDKLPDSIICTYRNIANISDTNKPSNEEYSIKAYAGAVLDMPVPGEASYKYKAPERIVPPPPEPAISAPPPSTTPGLYDPLKDDSPPPRPAVPPPPTPGSRPIRRATQDETETKSKKTVDV